MENLKNDVNLKNENSKAQASSDIVNDGLIKAPLTLGDSTNRTASTKYLKVHFENKNGATIDIVENLHENSSERRAKISFFNYYCDNIFNKLAKNTSIVLHANAKFMYNINERGHKNFFVVFRIKGRGFLFGFRTEENMILEDSISSNDANKKFYLKMQVVDKNGEVKDTFVNVPWIYNEKIEEMPEYTELDSD